MQQKNQSQSPLDRIKNKALGGGGGRKATFDTILYQLAKQTGSLGDLIGREFEVIYEKDKIVKVIQKPIKTVQLMALIKEAKAEAEREEIEYKKMNNKRGRR